MSVETITCREDVTMDWLTGILKANNLLQEGSIKKIITTQAKEEILSHNLEIEVVYSEDAMKKEPTKFFLKMTNEKLNSDNAQREVEFYNSIAPIMPGHMIPRCYDAVHSKNTGRSHMLFENLASTHFLTPFPLAPSNYYCKRIVEDLAEIHSFWWEKSDLKEEANNALNAIEFKNVFNNNIDNYQKWAYFLGDNLSPQRKELYNKVILTFPKVWETERILKRKRYTLIHNDAHPWNIFLPYQEDKDSVKFFDWSFWKIGVGVDDLAYFMALHWYPERRKHMEKSLLQSYYNKLIENGVKDYQWEECWDDYRLSVIDNLFTPIWQHSNNVPAYIWWHHLERIISAFQDLKCIELL